MLATSSCGLIQISDSICHDAQVRIAVVAESFLPQANGVTVTLLRLLEYLAANGDEVIVLAPAARRGQDSVSIYAGASVRRFRAVPLPGYSEMRLSTPRVRTLEDHLRWFDPDVVHLAAPFMLGWQAIGAAHALGLPSVAVYQTEVPSYAKRYKVRQIEPLLWRRIEDIHKSATLSLAPSSYACQQLIDRGVHRVAVWPHGVDRDRFSSVHRDDVLRASLLAEGEVLVGYVGRLAREKQVEDLAVLQQVPGVRLVVVGDGPRDAWLRRALPGAVFTGRLDGAELPRLMASLDVFVHTGEMDTFAQTIQEAQACGVPVVAPSRGGPIDLVQHGVNGFLYQPGQLAAMAQHVASLVADPVRRAEMGMAARESTAARTWDAVNEQVSVHYRNAITFAARDRAAGHRPARRWLLTR
ncbi:glycosyltransferase family 4 protein [Ruania halotolerans]|uniref:glycosyltransferase family 4 protein n=1 Tax=Ruania halotolerans TaxID=2897773 RepID=UPI001E4FCA43|nr:glycosyltransferase family 1 protein [Ruania halotolerans]UFU05021.1 glycosyltransferase family 1 protein [Ruania halotolerans]